MTVTRYDHISIKDLQAARKKLDLRIDFQYLLKTLNFNCVIFHNNITLAKIIRDELLEFKLTKYQRVCL
jgi:hypothetical protein